MASATVFRYTATQAEALVVTEPLSARLNACPLIYEVNVAVHNPAILRIPASPEIVDEIGKDQHAEMAEWIEAFDQVLEEEGSQRGTGSDRRAAATRSSERRRCAGQAQHALREHHSDPGRSALSRRPRAGTPHKKHDSLERDGDGHRPEQGRSGIGGHISTYPSLATLLEVGFNHFFHASYGDQPGDFIYFQGHASPGVYSRAFLEGRLSESSSNYRHELRERAGLSSYPHPWLMPDFWPFPTVSMGLAPINAIYQARFMRYLENRSLIAKTDARSGLSRRRRNRRARILGAMTLGSREKLDNLIFVVNCNLQRLDGPYAATERSSANWRPPSAAPVGTSSRCCGARLGPLFAKDTSGLLVQRIEESVDGNCRVAKPKAELTFARNFSENILNCQLVEDMTDEEICKLRRGGHDPKKVYNAYKGAVEYKGRPTVILARQSRDTAWAPPRRVTPRTRKRSWRPGADGVRSRFEIPIPEEAAKKGALYRPPDDSPEILYMCEQRRRLGGGCRAGSRAHIDFEAPSLTELPSRWRAPRAARCQPPWAGRHAAPADERCECR